MIKPDGRLSDDLDPSDQPPRDACGVFGAWSPGEDVAKLAYFGLYALQHRGQESAGIAVSDGNRIVVYKDMGLVPQVFDESVLNTLRGHMTVGHCRYSTSGSSVWANAQPTFRATPTTSLALGHNGNLTNTLELAALAGARAAGPDQATSDTDVLTALFAVPPAPPQDMLPGMPGDVLAPGDGARPVPNGQAAAAPAGGGVPPGTGPAPGNGQAAGDALVPQWESGVEQAALATLPLVRGAFSLVFMDERTLYAARDPQGFRPLVIGRLPRGWVVASETAALDIVGATVVREVEPGELIAIDERGLRSRTFAAPKPRGCLFEHVYLARPDTSISGRSVQATRVALGQRLAAEYPAEADLVIPVPESGTPAAIGYAQASGIPYGMGLVKNSYVGRTFIQPSQTIRQRGIRLKLNPLRDVIAGQRVVVVDDTIVRGNTQRAIVAMLREAGAAEVHIRISSPPVAWPCFFGIDFATRAELIAGSLSVEEIRQSIGADSLGFVSLAGLIEATTLPAGELCHACFTGEYPVPVAATEQGKHVLEAAGSRAGGSGGR
ncbi:MAG TPA: amidophosphoribosyltransferase [Streptosporangiaceae bacterium]